MKIPLEKKIEKMLPFLNEKQQRIYCALEAEAIGHNGVSIVSKASNKSRPTITLGKKQLKEGTIKFPIERVRKKGGGRKNKYEKHPELLSKLDLLVATETRGDP
ncbi:MAG: ISAzo13 family transposase, partial [Candidatus Woesebacteria bacterium]|nr:ISAzo13 family transposase [Candidatus Woesebacteria bacterium]